ncbi:hypothetical protein CLOM_g1187 [Closterium sp. NIES-68]|nr:hypothetical protein CLOM_g1187 [Closterium sp. NIES-68]
MAVRLGLSLLVFATLSLAAVANVVELTRDNFAMLVGKDKAAFVKFYAPWCGHCKKLAPDYDKFGSAFKETASVLVGKVDCDEHKALCSEYKVTGFPTLKWFPKGATSPEEYPGGRSVEDLVSFTNEKLGTSVKPPAAEPSDVVTLSPDNFDAVVLDPSRFVLVEFYAPWCKFCQDLAPAYEQLGQAFKAEDRVVIAKLDASTHRELKETYHVSGYPTIKWFPPSNKNGEEYNGAWELSDLVKFVNKEAGTHRTTTGKLSDMAGRIAALDEVARGFIGASQEEREERLGRAEKVHVTEEEAKQAAVYVKTMRSIVEKGDEYAENEVNRLGRLLLGALPKDKALSFTIRMNILSAFLELEGHDGNRGKGEFDMKIELPKKFTYGKM